MEEARRKKSGLIILIILLLALMAVGAFYYMKPHEYRVVIIPDPDLRQQPKGRLVFQYQWPDDLVKEVDAAYVCVCFKEQQLTSLVSCSGHVPAAELKCDASFKVARQGGYQPYRDGRTVSLPGKNAAAIQQVFLKEDHHFELGMFPDAQGVLRPKNIYIDGITADRFVKRTSKSHP